MSAFAVLREMPFIDVSGMSRLSRPETKGTYSTRDWPDLPEHPLTSLTASELVVHELAAADSSHGLQPSSDSSCYTT